MNDVLEKAPTGLFIDGAWRQAAKTFPVENPATGKPLVDVADAGPAEGVAALDAAVKAAKRWRETAPLERAELLRTLFELVIADAKDLARLMVLESGKALPDAQAEVRYGAEFLRWFSGEATRITGRYTISPDGRSRHVVQRKPVGPALLITPWNFPLAMITRKVGPALAAGCTMIIKPSELTPLTAAAFTELSRRAGVPAGVLNLVPTTDAGGLTTPLLEDGRLRKVSFTGSTAVGKKLIAASAGKLIRHSMELGGNGPFLVFADADLDQAVAGAMVAKFRNAGQACTAANRFLVDAKVADAFVAKFKAAIEALVVGDPLEEGVKVGAMINARAVEKVHALVQAAIADGAQVVVGGKRLERDGFFYAPTLLTGVPRPSRILHEEIFGPVAPITTFSSDDEAIAAANDTEHGLTSYLYTRDQRRAQWASEQLESGMLGVNTGLVSDPSAPFGGVKESGLGREGGAEGIEEYLDLQYVNYAT